MLDSSPFVLVPQFLKALSVLKHWRPRSNMAFLIKQHLKFNRRFKGHFNNNKNRNLAYLGFSLHTSGCPSQGSFSHRSRMTLSAAPPPPSRPSQIDRVAGMVREGGKGCDSGKNIKRRKHIKHAINIQKNRRSYVSNLMCYIFLGS